MKGPLYIENNAVSEIIIEATPMAKPSAGFLLIIPLAKLRTVVAIIVTTEAIAICCHPNSFDGVC